MFAFCWFPSLLTWYLSWRDLSHKYLLTRSPIKDNATIVINETTMAKLLNGNCCPYSLLYIGYSMNGCQSRRTSPAPARRTVPIRKPGMAPYALVFLRKTAQNSWGKTITNTMSAASTKRPYTIGTKMETKVASTPTQKIETVWTHKDSVSLAWKRNQFCLLEYNGTVIPKTKRKSNNLYRCTDFWII